MRRWFNNMCMFTLIIVIEEKEKEWLLFLDFFFFKFTVSHSRFTYQSHLYTSSSFISSSRVFINLNGCIIVYKYNSFIILLEVFHLLGLFTCECVYLLYIFIRGKLNKKHLLLKFSVQFSLELEMKCIFKRKTRAQQPLLLPY